MNGNTYFNLGIFTPHTSYLGTKKYPLLQNRGHAQVFKKTPSSAKYVTRVRPPLYLSAPPPRGIDKIETEVEQGWTFFDITRLSVGQF